MKTPYSPALRHSVRHCGLYCLPPWHTSLTPLTILNKINSWSTSSQRVNADRLFRVPYFKTVNKAKKFRALGFSLTKIGPSVWWVLNGGPISGSRSGNLFSSRNVHKNTVSDLQHALQPHCETSVSCFMLWSAGKALVWNGLTGEPRQCIPLPAFISKQWPEVNQLDGCGGRK